MQDDRSARLAFGCRGTPVRPLPLSPYPCVAAPGFSEGSVAWEDILDAQQRVPTQALCFREASKCNDDHPLLQFAFLFSGPTSDVSHQESIRVAARFRPLSVLERSAQTRIAP